MSKKGKVKEPCEIDRSVPKKKKRRAKESSKIDHSAIILVPKKKKKSKGSMRGRLQRDPRTIAGHG